MRWLYESEIVSPGDNWFDVLRARGADGWEAWHIDKDANGWREIYFKKPEQPKGG